MAKAGLEALAAGDLEEDLQAEEGQGKAEAREEEFPADPAEEEEALVQGLQEAKEERGESSLPMQNAL